MAVRRRVMQRRMEEEARLAAVRINVVGIGGCGNNIVTSLWGKVPERYVKLIAVNTDAAVLRKSRAHEKVLIGRFSMRGRGAQGVPELGEKAMEEDIEMVFSAMDDNVDLIIGVAGLGGGTGTGGLPPFFRDCNYKFPNAVKMAVVTLPMTEEGEERRRNAQFALRELLDVADVVLVNANDLALERAKIADITYAFDLVNRKILRSIRSIIRMQSYEVGPGIINVDFSNFYRICYKSGLGFAGVGRGLDVISSLEDALRDDYADTNLTDSKGAIAYFEGRSLDLDVSQVKAATNALSRRFRIPTVFVGIRPTWDLPELRVTLFATSVKSRYVENFLAEL